MLLCAYTEATMGCNKGQHQVPRATDLLGTFKTGSCGQPWPADVVYYGKAFIIRECRKQIGITLFLGEMDYMRVVVSGFCHDWRPLQGIALAEGLFLRQQEHLFLMLRD